MKLEQDPFLFEVDYDSLELKNSISFTASEYYPSSRRDLSFVTPNEARISHVLQEIENLGIKELKDIVVFDLFDKKSGENTQKSISIGLIFQAQSRTLKDTEIDDFMKKVIKMLETEFQITIR